MKRLVCLFLAGIATVASFGAGPELVNGVLVIVNDSVITYKDVQSSMVREMEFLQRRFAGQPAVLQEKARQLEQESLANLIEAQLILSEFKTNPKYQLPESYIESRINEDVRAYGDRLTLTKTLQAQGLTYESYRSKVREKVILDLMWRHHVPNDPIISPAKIERYYETNKAKFQVLDQVKLRMIVLPKRPGGPDPLALSAEIAAKLEEGAPFEELAKIYSQGSQAAQGGDWGWVEKTVLRQELSEVAFALKAGERSRPIETPDAVYIMQVDEVKTEHTKGIADARDEIEQTLKAEEFKRLRQQWIAALKKKAFVRYF